jgi:replicative DNA helicase
MSRNLPPQNTEVEQALLGAMMTESKAAYKAMRVLSPGDFYRPDHGFIFRAIVALTKRETIIDPLTLENEIRNMGLGDDQWGGRRYLLNLLEILYHANHIDEYISITKETANIRQLQAKLTDAFSYCSQSGVSYEEALGKATDAILSSRMNDGQSSLTLAEAVVEEWNIIEQAYQSGGITPRIVTGIKDLDMAMLGIQSGFTLIGARPSHGKTSLMMNIMERSKIEPDEWFIFYSLETNKHSISKRELASKSGIDLHTIRSAKFSENGDEWVRLSDAVNDIARVNVDLRCGSKDVNSIVAEVKIDLLEKKVAAVLIDYGQFLRANMPNEYERNTYVSQTLKSLSQDTGVALIVAVQLNRTASDDDHPTMKHIKGSGQWEQDADNVILIFNPRGGRNPQDVRPAKLLLEKQKDGAQGDFSCFWDGKTLRFASTERHLQEPAYWAGVD